MCDWSLVFGFSLGGLLMGFAIGASWMEARWERWRVNVLVPAVLPYLEDPDATP